MKKTELHTVKKLIGELVRSQRLKKQITQQELATLLNVDRQYVWKIENGRINLTLEYLDKIIFKLNCSNSDFFKMK